MGNTLCQILDNEPVPKERLTIGVEITVIPCHVVSLPVSLLSDVIWNGYRAAEQLALLVL
eukprot:6470546-Amphidinium_carterae.1